MTRILTAQDIFGTDDIKRELTPVPEWDGSVWVWCLNGTERSQYQEHLIGADREGNRALRIENADVVLAALSMRSESGERLFTLDDVAELGKKSAAALSRVTAAAQRLSAITPDAIEELLGNSDDLPERRFYFILARELGMGVGQMLREMDSREITEWMALYKIEAEERQRRGMEGRAKARADRGFRR